jgi:hypothetical protein
VADENNLIYSSAHTRIPQDDSGVLINTSL